MSEVKCQYNYWTVALLMVATFILEGAERAAAQRGPAFAQLGTASWYGPRFHGRKTANGEIFNQNKLTAAHRTLPLGTEVEVTNVKNGKSVEVRINDRGPYVRGRIIDLSRAAAIRLGIREQGLATVRIEAGEVRRGRAGPAIADDGNS